MKNGSRIRVALIYGGRSGEHSVSCMTAASVMAAIDTNRYELIPIGIRQDGTWVAGTTDTEVLGTGTATVGPGEPITMPYGTGLIQRGNETLEVDVVFPLLHGPFGEDGTVQGLLEMAGLKYVGSGVFASAAVMDKHYTKIVLKEAGLPVGPWVLVTENGWATRRDELVEQIKELAFPLFVKPSRAGSSLGISRIESLDELDEAIKVAQEHDPKVIVEQGITGREIECAVLGGHGTEGSRASLPGEIVLDNPDSGFYDYESKYVDTDGLILQIPAAMPDTDRERMRDMALRAFEAIDGEGMARVDFFYDNGDLVINEINTIPGFTPYSMYPLMWQKTGLTYSELIDELIELALERRVGLR
ncbi:D-alanine--D-alanine ligase family protein [Flaviflexus massiliensis]|uniref:D-alanine--D-alanine ligase family protein n=1 Tax=Flaviflexus massiliensis TaxID=1522309 RepID=UPI0006D52B42|nr:D-alanine--D-alanine ligase family protein [Flaviflexus massiliensis]